ncbi:peptidyl-tRNA hydrolase [Corynebacterium phocae]|uniref:Peptidyl-tRNA hydrolase n=1 Tax=Corynebacterium phocae TaxID=161895 RepID=A0A1L7D438_9CORY|nr:aminoacyl-tRNA hydrolase [Corynebacterium phocae]APT92936.1 peptidyl-tRNA hydrolase [Corynebacterium phocae]KAA8723269.1 aminoacyl-tRNA hydrolase [Corynebacterium phocae]
MVPVSTTLIIGLGNPGPKYSGTRHNIGFDVIDELASRVSPMPAALSVNKKTNTDIAEIPAGNLLSGKVILARPRSFMNLSGGPVKALAQYFGVSPADLIVIHDELEMEFGQVRLRTGGGDHGHNGLRSITKSLGTKDYQRLSVGIGRPPGRMDPASYVLKPWAKKESSELPIICADAADLVV